ncbi:MAG: shikimate kinase [Thermoanaerobaculales bacterium]
MRRVLITGMSGTGKSSVIHALSVRGFKAIDTGWNPDWEVLPIPGGPDADGPGWVWREDRISEVLSTEDADVLFLGACVPNQARFYARFDRIVLLSVSLELTVERLMARTNNPYGKSAADVAEVLRFKSTIEPILRNAATEEIDTSAPLGEMVAKIIEIARC